MSSSLKINDGNHLPSIGDGRFKVYSKQFNALVEAFFEYTPSFPTNIFVDTINENTPGAGVNVDGVILKDGAAIFTGDNTYDTDISKSGAGATQGTAAKIQAEYSNFSTVTLGASGAILPLNNDAGKIRVIKNSGAVTLAIYSPVGGTLDGVLNALENITAGSAGSFLSLGSNNWVSLT